MTFKTGNWGKVICIHETEDGQKPASIWTLTLSASVGLTKYGGLPPQVLEKYRLNIDAKVRKSLPIVADMRTSQSQDRKSFHLVKNLVSVQSIS